MFTIPCYICDRPARYISPARVCGHYGLVCGVHVVPDESRELGRVGAAMVTVLRALHARGPMRTIELFEYCWPGQAYGAHGATLDRLAAIGLIERVPEGRIRRVYLTEMGASVTVSLIRAASAER